MTQRFTSMLFMMSRLQGELNRLFQEAMDFESPTLKAAEWSPKTDVVETDASVKILAEVPGINIQEMQVQAQGRSVTISGRKVTRLVGAKRSRFERMERGQGNFSRTVQILQAVNCHKATAKLSNGILTVEIPKITNRRGREATVHIVIHEESPDG